MGLILTRNCEWLDLWKLCVKNKKQERSKMRVILFTGNNFKTSDNMSEIITRSVWLNVNPVTHCSLQHKQFSVCVSLAHITVAKCPDVKQRNNNWSSVHKQILL